MATTSPLIDSIRKRYLAAQLGGDRREALRLLAEGRTAGASTEDLSLEVVQEAQREIGLLWQQNKITVADEHQATAISHLALAFLYETAEPKPRVGKKIVITCVEGEQHDLPARLAADHLDLAGFEVRFLGANVPMESLLRTLSAHHPDLLALSCTMTFHLPSLRRTVEAVRALPG